MIWITALLFVLLQLDLSCGVTVNLNADYPFHSFTTDNYYDNKSHPTPVTNTWIVNAPSASEIVLDCSDINVAPTRICWRAYLSYYIDGVRKRFCHESSLRVTIPRNSVTVIFRSKSKTNTEFRGIACKVSLPGISTCRCGLKNRARIVNGNEATPNEYPWQAILRKAENNAHFCGGSVIAKQWVLTASHCAYLKGPDDIIVTLGDHNKTDDDPHSVNYVVLQIIMHEDYNRFTLNNDLALLKLDRLITYSDKIAPVCLSFNQVNLDLSGKMATVTGWGRLGDMDPTSDVLMEVDLPLLTTEECQSDEYSYLSRITENMICTYELGKDSCQGDSGGPLVWEDNTKHNFLVGIVSWGDGCGQERNPGVYTKVTNYLGWIENSTGAGCEFCRV